jgi:hypothetical protein
VALQDNPLSLGKNITECASTAIMANVGIPRVGSGHSEFSALFLLSSLHAMATLVLAEKIATSGRLFSRAAGPSFVVGGAGC